MLKDRPFDLRSLRSAYESSVTPDQVTDEVFRRIDAIKDPGIFLARRDRNDIALDISALGPFDLSRKPLWGVPFAIKDNIDAAGLPTTAACPDYAYVPERDAFVVDLLRRAGAILIGKTNMDQFATGLVGVRTPYPVPKNALDPEIVPGGSSSGSAVAVAHGLVSFALGTDTAGSGRVPAALNGIVGLKPSLGALSSSGIVPACRTLDTVSIFALTVADACRVFQTAAKFDPMDGFSRDVPVFPMPGPPVSFRVGVPDVSSRKFFGDECQAASFRDALAKLAELGGDPIELDFQPFYDVADMLYDGAWVAERYAAIEDLMASRPDAVHPTTRRIIEKARQISSADVFKGFYRLRDLKRATDGLTGSVDLLCVPTVPTFVNLREVEDDPIGPNARLGTYTNFVNLLDMCGLAVPTDPRADGRPGSVTLLAGADEDARIAAIGSALQHACGAALGATDWPLPPPSDTPPAAGPNEIALAAVGAHMSGLPLNGELTQLGSRFLFAGKTAPEYRLYSLPGGPPYRPGLVRHPGGAGIDLEVWAVPSARFGDFIRGVPHPLGIGTVTLTDGSEVKGFICEPIGIEGAREVTEFGGWRAYLDSLSNINPTDPHPAAKEPQHA